MLIRSLARVINGSNCHVFWCNATSCYLCMSRFSHDLKESALFGASLQRKFPEKQHINGFSKSVRLSEHCSRALDKQFPLFCFLFIYFFCCSLNRQPSQSFGSQENHQKQENARGRHPCFLPKSAHSAFLASPRDKNIQTLSHQAFPSRPASKHRFNWWLIRHPIMINQFPPAKFVFFACILQNSKPEAVTVPAQCWVSLWPFPL